MRRAKAKESINRDALREAGYPDWAIDEMDELEQELAIAYEIDHGWESDTSWDEGEF